MPKSKNYLVSVLAVEKDKNAPLACSLKVLFKSKDHYLYAKKNNYKPVVKELEEAARKATEITGSTSFVFGTQHFVYKKKSHTKPKDPAGVVDLTKRDDFVPAGEEIERTQEDSDYEEWYGERHERRERNAKYNHIMESRENCVRALEGVLQQTKEELWEQGWSKTEHSSKINPNNDGTLEEFRYCCEWLALCKKSKTLFANSSYGLKHAVEGWLKKRGYGRHIYNGVFIAAMIYMGFAPVNLWASGELNVRGYIHKNSLPILETYLQ